MSFSKIDFGKKGEDEAVHFLERSGYKILARNYRTRYGEIDIIAQEKDILVFIEVKNRSDKQFGLPEEAVTKYKQKQISKVALHYLCKNKINLVQCRFDVVAINNYEQEQKKRIKLIKNAFIIDRYYSF